MPHRKFSLSGSPSVSFLDMLYKSVNAMYNSLVTAIKEGLKKEGKVRLNGLGTFVVAKRKARTGVNPRTKAKIKIPATKAPLFRAAQALKDSVK